MVGLRLLGQAFYDQGLVFDPGANPFGVSLSNAVRATHLPHLRAMARAGRSPAFRTGFGGARGARADR